MNFGNSEKYDSVIINHNLSPKTRIGLTKEIWKPFLHYEKGYCYTFDPKRYNFSQNSVVYKGENLLRIKMNLDVSFQILDLFLKTDFMNFLLVSQTKEFDKKYIQWWKIFYCDP